MSVLTSDVKVYAAAVAPEDDTTTQIGGAIDTAKKHDFADFTGGYQVVSSSAADTTQAVTLTYRDADRDIVTDTPVALAGQTPVTGTATDVERVMKAVKSATCAGHVAVESLVVARSGTAQGPGAGTNTLQLDALASATDDIYLGMVVRLTGGPGSGEIAYVIAYNGTTKTVTVSRAWTTPPTAATTFRLSNGLVFDRQPAEIMTVSRLFYGATAGAYNETERKFYQRIYYKHTNASGSGLTLRGCAIAEDTDGAEELGADIKFDIDSAINSSSDNGAGNNRQVAPAGYTFTDTTKSVPGISGILGLNQYIGVWLELTLPAGQDAAKAVYIPAFSGNTPL